MDWILASASPRRKQLFKEIVETFDVLPARGEESAVCGSVEILVKTLATQKAREVAAWQEAEGKAVLGADTVVALDGRVLGKPKDEADARAMLKALSGREHEVYTGVCISYPNGDGGRAELVAAACTRVQFEDWTDERIDAYIATGSPMDKAGAYGIQGLGSMLVSGINGDYFNVVGLPVSELAGGFLITRLYTSVILTTLQISSICCFLGSFTFFSSYMKFR